MQNERAHNLKVAEKGAWISIVAYIALSALNLVVAQLTHSTALYANGLNNVTDILSNLAIVVGLRMARVPADSDHVYGHWKVESVASLITSFIMALVAFDLLQTTISEFFSHKTQSIEPIGAVIGVISAAVMFVIYFYNRNLGKRVASPALTAASKDNLTDALTSIGTSIAIVAASFHLEIIDQLMALLICGFIFRTAYEIFRDSAFSLTDGFDDALLESYEAAIEEIPKVHRVKLLRGRTYGSNIFLDVVIEMSPDMSVFESHSTTEEIEKTLREKFGVFDTDVHVEPLQLPDDEKTAALALKLLNLEERLNAGEQLIAADFREIAADGTENEKPSLLPDGIKSYQPQRISQKTFLLTYQSGENRVSSLWRRDEDWHCLYRQLTKKEVQS